MRRNEWGEPISDSVDMFGNPTGWTDGAGAVDMGDGMLIPTTQYETIRLPEELGGDWCAVLHQHAMRLPDGRIGIYHTLAHSTIDCISLRNGDGALWVRKPKAECEHLNYSDTMTGAVCNDCGAEEGGEEE